MYFPRDATNSYSAESSVKALYLLLNLKILDMLQMGKYVQILALTGDIWRQWRYTTSKFHPPYDIRLVVIDRRARLAIYYYFFFIFG